MSEEFWRDYLKAMRTQFRMPVTMPKATDFGRGVWPRFFSNELENNLNRPRRKNVHIAHADEGAKVSLFIQNRDLDNFRSVMHSLLRPGMLIGQTTSWATVSLLVPNLQHGHSISSQDDVLEAVSSAARQLFDFYIENEEAIFSTKAKGR